MTARQSAQAVADDAAALRAQLAASPPPDRAAAEVAAERARQQATDYLSVVESRQGCFSPAELESAKRLADRAGASPTPGSG